MNDVDMGRQSNLEIEMFMAPADRSRRNSVMEDFALVHFVKKAAILCVFLFQRCFLNLIMVLFCF